MGSTTGTPVSLSQKLHDMAHSIINGFETFLTNIKNNHGISASAVETTLGQAAQYVEESRTAITDAYATLSKEMPDVKVEPTIPPPAQQPGPPAPTPTPAPSGTVNMGSVPVPVTTSGPVTGASGTQVVSPKEPVSHT